jgi:biotin carboxyl carrier protein
MWRLIDDTAPPAGAAGNIEHRRGRRVFVAHTKGDIWLGYLGGATRLAVQQAQTGSPLGHRTRAKALTGTQTLRAPMAGRIVEHHGVVGTRCKQGATLVVLEAMKMEYKICAPVDGRITASCGAAGEAVALDAVLVTLVCDAEG